MQITSKGQVTIPIEFRKMFGFLPHTEVEFVVKDGDLLLKRSSVDVELRRQRFLEAVDNLPRPGYDFTTEEVMEITRGEDDKKAHKILERVFGKSDSML